MDRRKGRTHERTGEHDELTTNLVAESLLALRSDDVGKELGNVAESNLRREGEGQPELSSMGRGREAYRSELVVLVDGERELALTLSLLRVCRG